MEVRAYQFGNLTGVEALNPAFPRVSGTYAKLVDGLKEAGYTEGKDLFGAPFDFRLAADGLEQVMHAAVPVEILGVVVSCSFDTMCRTLAVAFCPQCCTKREAEGWVKEEKITNVAVTANARLVGLHCMCNSCILTLTLSELCQSHKLPSPCLLRKDNVLAGWLFQRVPDPHRAGSEAKWTSACSSCDTLYG